MAAPQPSAVRFRPRHVTTAILLGGLISAAVAGAPASNHDPALKAAALYNIVAFTDWPDGAFDSDDAPLVIGLMGQSPIVTSLADIAAKETWRGRRLKLLPVSKAADAKPCHVLLVARTERDRWRSLRGQLAGVPLLTVSDADRFVEDGGIVQLGIDHDRLRLIVNLPAARAAGLSISSKVLRIAQVIDDRAP